MIKTAPDLGAEPWRFLLRRIVRCSSSDVLCTYSGDELDPCSLLRLLDLERYRTSGDDRDRKCDGQYTYRDVHVDAMSVICDTL